MSRVGDGRPWSYAHALQPSGWTGATVRYNTGRHIAANGESLAFLIDGVVAAHLVAARLGTSEHNPAAALLGDMMVRSDSALGLGEGTAGALDLAERTVFPASNHFGLLTDHRVAAVLIGWLS